MDRRDEDAGAIAWPGFVDILSAVIIMFVFFVMITAIVMFALSVEHQKSMEAQNEERLQGMVSAEIQDIMEQVSSGKVTIEELQNTTEYQKKVQTLEQGNKALTNENKELKHELEKIGGEIEQIKAGFAQDLEQTTTLTDTYLIIFFDRNDISISETTGVAIEAYISSKTKSIRPENIKIKILAGDNPNAATQSAQRELSLARALNIRNVLLKNNIESSLISLTYANAEEINDSYSWIKIGVSSK